MGGKYKGRPATFVKKAGLVSWTVKLTDTSEIKTIRKSSVIADPLQGPDRAEEDQHNPPPRNGNPQQGEGLEEIRIGLIKMKKDLETLILRLDDMTV